MKVSDNKNEHKQFYEHYSDGNIYFCHTCVRSIKLKRLPSISFFNELYPGDIPNELAKLTEIELSLISQIRPYMKIYCLKGGLYGQKELKGSVVLLNNNH